jgi:hypothetical protein
MEDNIKIYLMKLGCEGTEEISLVQYRVLWQAVMNTVMNLRVPFSSLKNT